jgi:hypothetical protein
LKKYLRLQTVGDDECLYHYTHGSSLMNILRTEKLYATKSSFLNDTNELDYITHVAADVIGEIERPEWRQILMRQIIDTMEEVKRHDTFVLSFSTDRDSITLWAEFGEETGYNVGFREKDGFLLPYIEIDLSGFGCLPAARVTVAPKNHVDLAKKGMVQYLAHMNIKAEVVLSELKLRY